MKRHSKILLGLLATVGVVAVALAQTPARFLSVDILDTLRIGGSSAVDPILEADVTIGNGSFEFGWRDGDGSTFGSVTPNPPSLMGENLDGITSVSNFSIGLTLYFATADDGAITTLLSSLQSGGYLVCAEDDSGVVVSDNFDDASVFTGDGVYIQGFDIVPWASGDVGNTRNFHISTSCASLPDAEFSSAGAVIDSLTVDACVGCGIYADDDVNVTGTWGFFQPVTLAGDGGGSLPVIEFSIPSSSDDWELDVTSSAFTMGSEDIGFNFLYVDPSISGLTTMRLGNIAYGNPFSGSPQLLISQGEFGAVGDGITLQGSLFLTEVLTPTELASSQNNYNPSGLSEASVIRLSASTPVSITGLERFNAGFDGRVLKLVNIGSNDITLTDEDVSSDADNRFALSAAVVLGADETVEVWYDGTSQRWRAW